MTTSISDAFTYPVDKTTTDASHAPLGVALCQALAAAGLTKVSGPTTLADWETAAFVGDATTVWQFNDGLDPLYVRFILRTGITLTANDTGWEVTVCTKSDFTGDFVSANWFAGNVRESSYSNCRYFISYAGSCLVGHVDGTSSPNGFCVERARDGATPNGESAALFVAAAQPPQHVFKVLVTSAFPGTFTADVRSLQQPLGSPITLGKLHVTPISWFDRAGVRRSMAGVVLLPNTIGARQVLQITNAGQTKTYITQRDRPTFSWGISGTIPDTGNYTCALRWV